MVEFISRSAELLKLRTSEAAAEALQYIIEAMSTSIYSEKLIEMKAQALCIVCDAILHLSKLMLYQINLVPTFGLSKCNFLVSVFSYLSMRKQ